MWDLLPAAQGSSVAQAVSGYLRSKAHHKSNHGLYYGCRIAQFLLWPSPAALPHL